MLMKNFIVQEEHDYSKYHEENAEFHMRQAHVTRSLVEWMKVLQEIWSKKRQSVKTTKGWNCLSYWCLCGRAYIPATETIPYFSRTIPSETDPSSYSLNDSNIEDNFEPLSNSAKLCVFISMEPQFLHETSNNWACTINFLLSESTRTTLHKAIYKVNARENIFKLQILPILRLLIFSLLIKLFYKMMFSTLGILHHSILTSTKLATNRNPL